MPNIKTIYKILFAFTYSFVVLPFSTNFFKHIATPPTTESLCESGNSADDSFFSLMQMKKFMND